MIVGEETAFAGGVGEAPEEARMIPLPPVESLFEKSPLVRADEGADLKTASNIEVALLEEVLLLLLVLLGLLEAAAALVSSFREEDAFGRPERGAMGPERDFFDPFVGVDDPSSPARRELGGLLIALLSPLLDPFGVDAPPPPSSAGRGLLGLMTGLEIPASLPSRATLRGDKSWLARLVLLVKVRFNRGRSPEEELNAASPYSDSKFSLTRLASLISTMIFSTWVRACRISSLSKTSSVVFKISLINKMYLGIRCTGIISNAFKSSPDGLAAFCLDKNG